MALSIGELAAYLTVDDSKFEKGLKGAQGKFEATGAKLKASADKYGAMAGKALAAGLLAGGAAAYKMTQKASDLAETMNKSEVIFGRNAASIDKWAATAAIKMGLSKQAALEAASGFGDMFSQIGFTGTQAAEMSKTVVQMSADLGSFNNLPTAEVADMMSAAFRGEYDSLQRLIPNINATRVETEALAMTGKKSADQLTAQEKAAATLAIVQKDGAKAQGDFARTADSLANQQKTLTAQFANFQAELGTKLLPVMTKLSGVALKMLDWIERNQTLVIKLTGVVGGLTASVWLASVAIKAATVVMTVASAATKGYAAAKALLTKASLGTRIQLGLLAAQTAITTGIQKAARGATLLLAGAQKVLNAAMRANPIGIIITLLVALGAGLVMAYKKSTTFRKIVNAAFGAVKRVVMGVWNWIKKNWPLLLAILTGPIGLAVLAIAKNWDKIKSGARAVKDFVVDKFRDIARSIGELPGKLRDLASKFKDAGSWLMTSFMAGLKTIAGKAGDIASGIWEGVKGYLNSAIGKINSAIPNSIGKGPLTVDLPDNPFPTFARGGTMLRSGLALVGEEGPELAYLPGGTRIKTAAQTRQLFNTGIAGAVPLPRTPALQAAAAPGQHAGVTVHQTVHMPATSTPEAAAAAAGGRMLAAMSAWGG